MIRTPKPARRPLFGEPVGASARKHPFESKTRSVLKALSWRFFATIITMLVAYALTGHLTFALEIGLLDTSIKLGAYFIHERVWLRLKWGQRRGNDYQI